jgi:hypothetical protein
VYIIYAAGMAQVCCRYGISSGYLRDMYGKSGLDDRQQITDEKGREKELW